MRRGVGPPEANTRPTSPGTGADRRRVSSPGTGARLTPTEYGGHRVRVRPDILKLEPLIREHLSGVQKRDGPEATIVSADRESDEVYFNLDIDNVPGLHRFKAKDCGPVEGTTP
jgi:hypothetical protein